MKLIFLFLLSLSVLLHADTVKIHFVGASKEYKAEDSLKAYKKVLESTFKVEVTETYTKDKSKDAPNFDKVKDADILVVFARRLTLSKDNLKLLKGHLEAGKPVIGIRTASHAFQNYLELDAKYFGGSYKGHGKDMKVEMAAQNSDDEILKGIKIQNWQRHDKPYYNDKNAADVKVLLTGKEPGGRVHPMAWSREINKQRLFYTSLGLPADFKDERFVKLLNNALGWALKGTLERK